MTLSFLLALLPILWLIVAMSILKMPGWKACLIAFALAFAEALILWKMPILDAATASLEGICNALWPIVLVILAALFTYNVTVETGSMDRIKGMLASVSGDRRIIMLLIAFGFGNFMEGMAGFGTAVAIPAGILAGLGFDPVLSIVSCLVINSTPTAFGSAGIPTTTLANLTGLNATGLAANIVSIQFLLSFLLPFLGVIIIGKGFKALKGLVPFILIADLAFLLPQYFTAKYLGPDLPNIIGSVVSMLAMVACIKWLPMKTVPEFDLGLDDRDISSKTLTLKSAWHAWSPFILIFVFLLLSSKLVPFLHDPLSSVRTTVKFFTGEGAGKLTFYWINTPGVWILLAGILGGLIQGATVLEIGKILFKTVKDNVYTIITICSVLALAKVMSYSGMISDIAAVLVTLTGTAFPLISPLIGTLGGFVTGSGTSTQALFGQLQAETARAINMDPMWLGAANMMGAGIGKMICPQGIAIGSAACGLQNAESKILAKAAPYVAGFLILGGLLCYILPKFIIV